MIFEIPYRHKPVYWAMVVRIIVHIAMLPFILVYYLAKGFEYAMTEFIDTINGILPLYYKPIVPYDTGRSNKTDVTN